MEYIKNIVLEMEIKDLISLGVLGVAFLALFVAPYINSMNSKRQVVAPMRQAWINALRDKVSEYVSIISIERLHISPSENDSKDEKEIAHKEDRERYQRLKLLQASIELHINPKENDHQELVKILKMATEHYHNNDSTKLDSKKLIKLAQKILKNEWKVTKKA